MKVVNKNPYFGAAEERHVIRGCGDEADRFGMLTPRAWQTAQDVLARNRDDLPDGWEEAAKRPVVVFDRPVEVPQPAPRWPLIAIAVIGWVIALLAFIALARAATTPAPRQPALAIVRIGERVSIDLDGDVRIYDELSDSSFFVKQGESFSMVDPDQ